MANTTVPAELINTATPLGRRNILINGDFGIAQRATSSILTAIEGKQHCIFHTQQWR